MVSHVRVTKSKLIDHIERDYTLDCEYQSVGSSGLGLLQN